MVNKKSIFLIVVFLIISKNLFANNNTSDFLDSCYANIKPQKIDELKIENISIEFSKNKQWVKNLFNIHLYFEKKKYESEHEKWFSNFRIKDKYKKRFNANILVKFKDYKKCKFKAKVRVTGDLWWHLNWKKGSPISSLHVKLLNGNLYNVTQFKLFLKEARYDKNEIFVANLFKELGFISPKTFYVNAKVNNVNHQYIFQEDIRKELIESSSYREGPLLEGDERFTVSLTEKEKKNFPNINFAKIVNKKFLKKNSSNSISGLEALTNMNKLYLYNHNYKLNNKIYDPFSHIFYLFSNNFFSKKNSEILNTFEALSIAIDIEHGLSMDDRRFYFDPFSKFYLPIYYDGKSQILEKNQHTNINNKTFSYEAVQGSSNAIKKINNLDLKLFLIKLKKSGLNISENELKNTINKILSRLEMLKEKNKFKDEQNDNNNFFENEHDKNNLVKFIFTEYKKKQFSICDFDLKNCNILKFKKSEYFKILNEFTNQEFNFIQKNMSTKSHMIFLFDEADINKQTFNFFNDDWNYLDELKNTKIFYKNVDIFFDERNRLISAKQTKRDGKILFLGGKLNKWNINFEGVTNVSNIDILNNYDISNNYTGCLSFYEVEFDSTNITSTNSDCEDSVNIIRGQGKINKILINNSASDALDVDFSNLSINNVTVNTASNDCIDFSSGNYNLGKLYLQKCGDKALSVGEKSFVQIDEIYAKNSIIGIASKDSSIVNLEKGNFENLKFCLSAYKKKQEFNGGFITVKNLNCKNYYQKVDVDLNSRILLKKELLKNNEFGNIYNQNNLNFTKLYD